MGKISIPIIELTTNTDMPELIPPSITADATNKEANATSANRPVGQTDATKSEMTQSAAKSADNVIFRVLLLISIIR